MQTSRVIKNAASNKVHLELRKLLSHHLLRVFFPTPLSLSQLCLTWFNPCFDPSRASIQYIVILSYYSLPPLHDIAFSSPFSTTHRLTQILAASHDTRP
jgi:hypothetical protein